jgi:hypothetical protein
MTKWGRKKLVRAVNSGRMEQKHFDMVRHIVTKPPTSKNGISEMNKTVGKEIWRSRRVHPHIEVLKKDNQIRLRVDGELTEPFTLSKRE